MAMPSQFSHSCVSPDGSACVAATAAISALVVGTDSDALPVYTGTVPVACASSMAKLSVLQARGVQLVVLSVSMVSDVCDLSGVSATGCSVVVVVFAADPTAFANSSAATFSSVVSLRGNNQARYVCIG